MPGSIVQVGALRRLICEGRGAREGGSLHAVCPCMLSANLSLLSYPCGCVKRKGLPQGSPLHPPPMSAYLFGLLSRLAPGVMAQVGHRVDYLAGFCCPVGGLAAGKPRVLCHDNQIYLSNGTEYVYVYDQEGRLMKVSGIWLHKPNLVWSILCCWHRRDVEAPESRSGAVSHFWNLHFGIPGERLGRWSKTLTCLI